MSNFMEISIIFLSYLFFSKKIMYTVYIVGGIVRKFLFIIPILGVMTVFFVTYQDHSVVLKEKEYVQNMMDNIDTSYQVTVRQMENIRGYFVQMQAFFEQDPSTIELTYSQYYALFTEIRGKMKALDKYVSSLKNYCSKIGAYQNNQCSSYQDNVDALKENYQTLVEKYNQTIAQYNLYSKSSLVGI